MDDVHNDQKFLIADAHTHIYPAKIAEKATASVGDFYHISMDRIGYPHTLLESGAAIGVKKFLVCSVATKPEQVHSINNFIHEKCLQYPQFLGFATLHPALQDWEQELERIVSLGLRGIKLHPDFQSFHIDDHALVPVYRKIQQLGIPILFHMGDARYDYSSPQRLRRVIDAIPGLKIIAAHLGGYQCWEDAARYLGGCNIWFDTSSSLFALEPSRAAELIRAFGPQRVMFGTDFPMWGHREELARFLSLPLSAAEQEQILHATFEQLFGLSLAD